MNIKDITVGQYVDIIGGVESIDRVPVDRITKTQIVVGGRRFRRVPSKAKRTRDLEPERAGSEIGGTGDLYLSDELERQRLVGKIRDTRMKFVPLETLRTIERLLAGGDQ